MRAALAFALLLAGAAPALAQRPAPRLDGRWVGTHNHQPLHLDFYGDTMVVVNDRWVLYFRATFDSLVVWGEAPGDTAFAVAYWFSLDRLLLQTAEGRVVTMAQQSPYARPIEGRWQGSPVGQADRTVLLQLWRGGVARRRVVPGGEWVDGEWDRRSRIIQFTWLPDSTTWTAYYDPPGEALLFDSTDAETGTLVLRKVYR